MPGTCPRRDLVAYSALAWLGACEPGQWPLQPKQEEQEHRQLHQAAQEEQEHRQVQWALPREQEHRQLPQDQNRKMKSQSVKRRSPSPMPLLRAAPPLLPWPVAYCEQPF